MGRGAEWTSGRVSLFSGAPIARHEAGPTPAESAARRPSPSFAKAATWLGIVVALLLGWIYHESPRRIFLDSRFALLTSESLLDHGSFDLSPYLPWIDEGTRPEGESSHRLPYQLARERGGGLLYIYPLGTPVLSLPFVPVLKLLGAAAVDASGRYSARRERVGEALVATWFAALTAFLLFCIVLREVSAFRAAVLTLVLGLGTGLWSVASRTLWSHSAETLLAGAVWLELLRWEDGREERPILLGTLLSLAFWVRPTSVVLIVPVVFFVVWRHRRATIPLLATGAIGLGAFVGLSYPTWHHLLPNYFFRGGELTRVHFVGALLSLLLSPGRSPFAFTPLYLAAGWLLVRHGVNRARRPLVWLAMTIVAGYFVLYANWSDWWSPGGVGPRFFCVLTPLLGWMCALAWRRTREVDAISGRRGWVVGLRGVAVCALSLASIAAHAPLALDRGSQLHSRHHAHTEVSEWRDFDAAWWSWRALPQFRTRSMLQRTSSHRPTPHRRRNGGGAER